MWELVTWPNSDAVQHWTKHDVLYCKALEIGLCTLTVSSEHLISLAFIPTPSLSWSYTVPITSDGISLDTEAVRYVLSHPATTNSTCLSRSVPVLASSRPTYSESETLLGITGSLTITQSFHFLTLIHHMNIRSSCVLFIPVLSRGLYIWIFFRIIFSTNYYQTSIHLFIQEDANSI